MRVPVHGPPSHSLTPDPGRRTAPASRPQRGRASLPCPTALCWTLKGRWRPSALWQVRQAAARVLCLARHPPIHLLRCRCAPGQPLTVFQVEAFNHTQKPSALWEGPHLPTSWIRSPTPSSRRAPHLQTRSSPTRATTCARTWRRTTTVKRGRRMWQPSGSRWVALSAAHASTYLRCGAAGGGCTFPQQCLRRVPARARPPLHAGLQAP